MEAMGHADPVAVWKCAGPDTSLRLRCPGKSQESFCEPKPFSGSTQGGWRVGGLLYWGHTGKKSRAAPNLNYEP